YLCTLVSNFMSSTAAANILLPIGVSLAPGSEAQIAIPLAFAASVGICLPISTPPNALVYSSGAIQTRELVRVGLLFGLLVPPIAVGWVTLLRGYNVWRRRRAPLHRSRRCSCPRSSNCTISRRRRWRSPSTDWSSASPPFLLRNPRRRSPLPRCCTRRVFHRSLPPPRNKPRRRTRTGPQLPIVFSWRVL